MSITINIEAPSKKRARTSEGLVINVVGNPDVVINVVERKTTQPEEEEEAEEEQLPSIWLPAGQHGRLVYSEAHVSDYPEETAVDADEYEEAAEASLDQVTVGSWLGCRALRVGSNFCPELGELEAQRVHRVDAQEGTVTFESGEEMLWSSLDNPKFMNW